MTGLPRIVYKRLHFYVGNIFRLITSLGFQKTIPLDEVRSIFGASFDPKGWNHIGATLREYDANHDIDYRNTTMYSFLKKFNPSSICDLLDGKHTVKLPLFVYPWGTFKSGEFVSKKNADLSRFCGPSSDIFIKEEFDRTIALYKKVKLEGYQPWLFGNTFVGGTFLVRSDGARRFIVLQGNHRMAILGHLGYKNIAVRSIAGHLFTVKEANISEWLLVKLGLCPQALATDIFNLFFKENGIHLAEILK